MSSSSEKPIDFSEIEIIEKIIEESDDKHLSHLSSSFAQKIKINQEVYSEKTIELLRLLKDITSMMLNPRSNNEPFQAFIVMADGQRSALPSDLSFNDLNILSEAFDKIRYKPLKARIGDLLWIRLKPRNPTHAKAAIDCYISEGVNPQTWRHTGNKEFERACRRV